MSVLKKKRKKSKFEVLHLLYKVREEFLDRAAFDFGFNLTRAKKKLLRYFGVDSEDELRSEQMASYRRRYEKLIWFSKTFIEREREIVLTLFAKLSEEVFLANSIYPIYDYELNERRLHQDRAIGYCFTILQEWFFILKSLEVDRNIYTNLALLMNELVFELKEWRRKNKYFAVIHGEPGDRQQTIKPNLVEAEGDPCKPRYTSGNHQFANVNTNGNANCNNSTNSNGVRPDLSTPDKG